MRKIRFACCFCGEGIEVQGVDPCTLVLVAENDEDSQTMWCHIECLKSRAVHGIWSPAFGGDDDEWEGTPLTKAQFQELGEGIEGVTEEEIREFLREINE